MGMDIYSGRGVIFTVDEFLKVINGKSKSEVVAVCQLSIKTLQLTQGSILMTTGDKISQNLSSLLAN